MGGVHKSRPGVSFRNLGGGGAGMTGMISFDEARAAVCAQMEKRERIATNRDGGRYLGYADYANVLHQLIGEAGRVWAQGDDSEDVLALIGQIAAVAVRAMADAPSILPHSIDQLFEDIEEHFHPDYSEIAEGLAAMRHHASLLDETIESGVFGGSSLRMTMMQIATIACTLLIKHGTPALK
jgi:hypothetical protein